MHDTQARQRTTVPEKDALTGAGSTPAPVRRPRRVDWRKRGEIALLAGPALIMFLGFVILPVAMAAFYGFFKWNGFGWPTEFIGLDNYVMIWQDDTFRQAVMHNGIILVLSLVLQGPIAILFALLMNQKIRGRSIIRILIFVPYVISEVIVGIGWSLMLQDAGALNSLLEKWGMSDLQQSWIADPAIAMTSLMIIITWKYIGFAVILMLAGMQSIPEELYEAAAIDGAGFWKTQWAITVPLLGPTIRIWAFLSIIGSLQLFDLVNIIWGQYIAATAGTSTMATYMYQNGHLAGSYGFGNAVAVMLFIITLIVALLYQRFVLRRDTEGALTGDGGRKRK
ncbi:MULTISPECIES: carbohydrate ABC transporter permease [unclassified Microbacterium]|uniref:carbohydrate ABC transporter permease n=1 Tax=unclassified Microbacterium TaxID=2609290 RepID=UPI0008FCC858|nr:MULTISPECIES: sugar ABC transporter permease [unclassified Microbacterium]OIU87226.1 sugar ABC transporter permease [Microbacterium sp. AR7-10]